MATIDEAKARLKFAIDNDKAHWSLMAGSDLCTDVPVADLKAVLEALATSEARARELEEAINVAIEQCGRWVEHVRIAGRLVAARDKPLRKVLADALSTHPSEEA